MDQGRGVRSLPQELVDTAARFRFYIVALSVLALLGVPAVSQAQIAGVPTSTRSADAEAHASRFASPFLPPDHWSLGAARRLEVAGLAPAGFGGGAQSHTQRELAILFLQAELRAGTEAPELAALVRSYRLRFGEEFPGATDAVAMGGMRSGLQGLGFQIRAGYETHTGEVLTGVGYHPVNDWTGAASVPDRRGAASVIHASMAIAPHVAVSISPGHRNDRWEIEEGHATVTYGGVGLWGGRRAVGFHPGAGGGIVLSPNQVFDGGGLFLDGPVVLPGWLRYLGPLRLEFLLTKIENGDRITSPWFGAMHSSLQPHPRLEVGVSRANIFGGKGNSPTTLGSIAQMLVGLHAGDRGEYNNEVFSANVRFRPPLGRLPLAVYMEWGMDDSAGAWRNVPARVLGLELAALPRIPQVALGIERTSFAGGCCGNTVWYRNWSLRGGWAASGQPLGHPLGGHGTEWLAYSRADLFDARVHLDLQLFDRDRGAENLVAPEREGRSRGGRLGLEARHGSGWGIFFQGRLEDGDAGWRESAARAGLQVIF